MSAKPLRIAVLDVGQGDTIVVSCPSTREAVVVDCVDEHGVFQYLRSQSIQKVRALILTHLHSDHYRRAVGFLRNCERHLGVECERLIITPFPDKLSRPPDPDEDSELFPREFESLERWMMENYDRVYPAPTGRQLPFEGVLAEQIDFVFPYTAHLPRARAFGYNNTSIVLRVRGSGSSALLTGDMESAGWELIPRRNLVARADVLKFPHHGAWKKRDGSPADASLLLNEVKASFVIFSVGSRQKGYNHPDPHVFTAARAAGATILCTQATRHCGLSGEEAERHRSVPILESQLNAIGVPPVLCASGTPCAGSVIIDLESTPIVRSPTLAVHRQIVERLFAEKHQCYSDKDRSLKKP